MQPEQPTFNDSTTIPGIRMVEKFVKPIRTNVSYLYGKVRGKSVMMEEKFHSSRYLRNWVVLSGS